MLEQLKEKTRVSRTIAKVVRQKKAKSNGRIKVFFLCQYIQGWNKFEGVFRLMEEMEQFEPYLLAIPDNINEFPQNKEFDFWNKQTENVINAVENGKWFDLRVQEPDYVFVQRPYNNYLPVEYHTVTLMQYTRLCYIPYGYLLGNIRSIVSPPEFSELIYMYFAENQYEKKYLDKSHPCMKLFHIKKNYSLGYPALDPKKPEEMGESAFKSMQDKEKLYKIIWTPRWTADKNLGGTHFFEYKDKIIQFIRVNKELGLVFRPHPMAFDNFIQTGLMSKGEVDQYLSFFDKRRLAYDKESLYYKTFLESECLITDFSSIIVEYLLTGKPIIFCYDDEEYLNETMKEITKVCYCAKNWEEVEQYVMLLQKGEDYLMDKRRKMIKKLAGTKKNTASERIVNAILKDFRR